MAVEIDGDKPDKPKVVDMKGVAVEPVSETPEKVWEILRWAEQCLKGETHTGIGIVIVDHMGRTATHHYWKAGSGLSALGGATLLQHRMIVNYEKTMEDPTT